MKKKILLTLTATVCAACCAVGPVACGGGHDPSKVKDEAQWKSVIADARKSDNVLFSAEISTEEVKAEITVKADGDAQYLMMTNTDSESNAETWEYYYDGDYVYLNVTEQGLGYTWQKIDASTVKDEFPEPLGFIEKVYSGDIAYEMLGVEMDIDDLEELSFRYADAQYGYNSEKYGADTYVIVDGEGNDDGVTYLLSFNTDKKYLRLTIEMLNSKLVHQMNADITVTVPTESVQMAEED